MNKILECFIKIFNVFYKLENKKMLNHINIVFHILNYEILEDQDKKNRKDIHHILNNFVNNINIYINKKRHECEKNYQLIYRNLIIIKKCINNKFYLKRFINNYKKNKPYYIRSIKIYASK